MEAGGGSSAVNQPIAVTVNGWNYQASVEPRLLLSDFLRDTLGLTGTHVGCEHGVCGACTVLMNGDSIRSCLTLAMVADGADITTVEGLGSPDELNAAMRLLHPWYADDQHRPFAEISVGDG
jgi:aerobic-type carbon monoxide dehydrogenase small subunit (CoxS/CutS family)